MKTKLLAFAAIGAITVAGPFSGCSLTTDHFSCGVDTGGKLVRCVDYSDVDVQFRTTIEALCRGIGGDFNTSKTCPGNKVAGCRQVAQGYTQVAWYYPESIAPTPEDVAGRCSGNEVLVSPDGTSPDLAQMSTDQAAPLDLSTAADGARPLCSTTTGAAVTLTFVNHTSGPVKVYWVDDGCVERLYFTLSPGASMPQGTFASHVWRMRDAGGTSIKEIFADPAMPTIDIP